MRRPAWGTLSFWASHTVSKDAGAASHVVVGLIVQYVAHKQDDRLAPEVLPPMRGAAGLRHDIAGLSLCEPAGPGIHSIGYFAFTLDVMEVITLDAILN